MMFYHIEGEAAIRDLNCLSEELGYCSEMGQPAVLNFLKHNPDCVKLIYNWINEQYSDQLTEEN
jgi:hypothetical protein